ncbi:unnamed protein product [Agarophyton chilense]
MTHLLTKGKSTSKDLSINRAFRIGASSSCFVVGATSVQIYRDPPRGDSRFRYTPACSFQSGPPVFSRIRRWFNRKQSRPVQDQRKRKATDADWEKLIIEFEERSGGTKVVPPDSPILNPKQYETLPYLECAYMTALTTVLWYLGRVFRLDAVLLLFYPLPTIYIASKYGLKFADWTIMSVLFFVFTIVGPLFAITYFLNTGLLTIVYARALWWRFGWFAALLFGAAAKAVGLCLQLLFISPILRYNAWKAVVEQVTILLQNMAKLLGAVGIKMMAPTASAVQIALIIVIAFHSLYHVFFTLLMSSIVLRRIEADVELKRSPVKMPLVDALIRNAKNMRRR